MADTQPVSPVAHGTAVFAGVLMIIGGAFQALEALAAIVNDKYLVVLPQYIYAFDLTLWGWIHLLVGLGCWQSASPCCKVRPGLAWPA